MERYNRTLNEMLSATTGEHPTTGDQRIPLLTMTYNIFVPIDIMIGQPEYAAREDELYYVCGLWERLEVAYVVAREHWQHL